MKHQEDMGMLLFPKDELNNDCDSWRSKWFWYVFLLPMGEWFILQFN